MPRRRRRPAPRQVFDPSVIRRMQDQAERDLAAVLEAIRPPARPFYAKACRDLGLAELGCYVYIPAPDYAPGTRGSAEPSVEARAGRLVGIRVGAFPTDDDPTPLRSLVLQQGGQTAPVSVRVDVVVGIRPES